MKKKKVTKRKSNTSSGKISASRRKRKKQLKKRIAIVSVCAFIGVILLALGYHHLVTGRYQDADLELMTDEDWIGAPKLDVKLLDVNEYSRPQIPLKEVNGIVIHYTANPGSSAKANRDYFNNLKDSHTTKASSHFIIGLEGEVIQCIPTKEISYASNDRNSDTISIECCHPDDSGKYNDATYQSVVQLTGWLCVRFGLTSEDVIRHYDVTGKLCPKYFVENEDAWNLFKVDVENKIQEIKQLRSI